MDLRQSIAGVLTISMFIMLGNMIKKEHVDPIMGYVPVEAELQLKVAKYSNNRRVKLSTLSTGPWIEDHLPLNPCLAILPPPHEDGQHTRGNIFFTLSHEPEYHAFQVGIAIMIARKLGVAFVLPDISYNNKIMDKNRLFGDVYDIKHFITSLEGVVHVIKDPPKQQYSKENTITLKISTNTLSEQMVETKIQPLFEKAKRLRFTFQPPSSSIKRKEGKQTEYMNPYTCLAMFRTLKLQPELQLVVDSIVGTLRSWSSTSFGKFVALDLRTEGYQFKNNSFESNSSTAMNKEQFNDPKGISQFLERIGFERQTTMYLSQVGRHDERLVLLRQHFPTTFTKEAIFPMELKAKYLNTEDIELRKLIDLHVCVQSDVFVSGYQDQFQSSVVAMRISSGKMQILSPAETSSKFAVDYVPSYVSKKTHMAYTCFC